MYLSLVAAAAWLLATALSISLHDQSPVEFPWASTRTVDLHHLVTDLRKLLSSEATITLPSDPRWETLLTRSSHPRLSPNYSVVVEIGTESDVQATVYYAHKHGIPFLAVSGAHGWVDSLNRMPYGIQINMRRLNTTVVDEGGRTATIGGGTLQWEATRALFAKGRTAVTGLCECTSVIGPLLGGGHSILQNQHGYALDNLVSARVILANGTLVEASNSKNPDLFWALRGAGHNFGIVTSFVVKVYEAKIWTVYSLVFTQNKLEALFALINEYEDGALRARRELALTGVFVRIPAIDAEKPVIAYTIAFNGPQSAAAPHAAPFLTLKPAATTITTNVNYTTLYTVTGNNLDSVVCAKNHNLLGAGASLPSWDIPGVRSGFEIFAAATKSTNLSFAAVLIENYGMQGVRAIDPYSTALAAEERSLPVLTSAVFWWEGDDEEIGRVARNAAEGIREAFYAGRKRHVYVNYAVGDEGVEEVYGREEWRVQRLKGLKEVWDAGRAFGWYNPVE